MEFKGMDLTAFDVEKPEESLNVDALFSVKETDIGDVVIPENCEIVGFQWAPPDNEDGTVHLYVYVRRRSVVTGVVLWPMK